MYYDTLTGHVIHAITTTTAGAIKYVIACTHRVLVITVMNAATCAPYRGCEIASPGKWPRVGSKRPGDGGPDYTHHVPVVKQHRITRARRPPVWFVINDLVRFVRRTMRRMALLCDGFHVFPSNAWCNNRKQDAVTKDKRLCYVHSKKSQAAEFAI